MAPVPHAAALQRSRTLNSAWRHSNQSLIRGGAMQLQSRERHGDAPASSAFPSWQQPLSSLLSPDSVAESHQLSPVSRPTDRGNGRHQRASMTSELLSLALRDRVANTQNLNESLRSECLERLDQISIPKKMRRRPSWTHLEEAGQSDVKDQSAQFEDIVECDGNVESDPMTSKEHDATSNTDVHTELPGDRTAAMNFLKEFHSMPPPPIAELCLEKDSPALQSAPQRRAKKTKEPHLQEQCRYKNLWSVEDRDLSKAAAVWKSTAKSHSRSSPPSPESSLRLPEVGAMVVGAKATAVGLFSIEDTKRAVEEAKSTIRLHEHADPRHGAQRVPLEEVPRGMSSLLRTTLRHALQA